MDYNFIGKNRATSRKTCDSRNLLHTIFRQVEESERCAPEQPVGCEERGATADEELAEKGEQERERKKERTEDA